MNREYLVRIVDVKTLEELESHLNDSYADAASIAFTYQGTYGLTAQDIIDGKGVMRFVVLLTYDLGGN